METTVNQKASLETGAASRYTSYTDVGFGGEMVKETLCRNNAGHANMNAPGSSRIIRRVNVPLHKRRNQCFLRFLKNKNLLTKWFFYDIILLMNKKE